MDNSNDRYIDELERKLKGLPPRKEILLPLDSMVPAKEVGKELLKLFQKKS